MNSENFKSQLLSSYEKGRFKAALKSIWYVLPVILVALCTCGSAGLPLLIGCALVVAVVLLKWRGQEYGFSVGPGLIAGVIAFSIPLVLHLLELCCHNDLEVLFCALSGILGGAILGHLVSKSKRPHKLKSIGFSILIAGLTAALGCASLGVGATLGLFSALVFASLSALYLKMKRP